MELEKISIEIETLKFKAPLEQSKLQLEIGELKQASHRASRTSVLTAATAILSTITTLIVALVSGYISLQIQRFADRQHDADTYSKLLQDLGGPNALARAGAIVSLTKYAMNPRDEKSEQTITILITQLASETEPRVLRVLVPSIAGLGPRAVNELTRANQVAVTHFVDAMHRMVRPGLAKAEVFPRAPNNERTAIILRLLNSTYDGIAETDFPPMGVDLMTQKEKSILYALFDDSDANRAMHDAMRPIASGKDGLFGLESTMLDPRLADLQTATETQDFKDATKVLYATSITLTRLLEDTNLRRDSLNLQNTALIAVDFHGLRFKNCDFSGSILIGDAGDADFTGSKFYDADISNLIIQKANFNYTTLDSVKFPNITDSHDDNNDSVIDIGGTNLTGADWWNVRGISRDGNTSAEPIFYSDIGGIKWDIKYPNGHTEASCQELTNYWTCPVKAYSIVKNFHNLISGVKKSAPYIYESLIQFKILREFINYAQEDEMGFTIDLCPSLDTIRKREKSFETKFPKEQNWKLRKEWRNRMGLDPEEEPIWQKPADPSTARKNPYDGIYLSTSGIVSSCVQ